MRISSARRNTGIALLAAALALSGSAQAANGFVKVHMYQSDVTQIDAAVDCTTWVKFSDGSAAPFYQGEEFIPHGYPREYAQISVGDGGATWWGTDIGGLVFRYDVQVPLPSGVRLREVAAGNGAQTWGLSGSDNIYRFNGTVFVQVAGSLRDISVAADGSVWGVNASGQILRWFKPNILVPGVFVQVAGPALTRIEVGNAKAVWGLDAAGLTYRYDGTSFVRATGALKDLSVGADGTVWGLNLAGQTVRWDGSVFRVIASPAFRQIRVGGSDGCVWGVGVAGGAYLYKFK